MPSTPELRAALEHLAAIDRASCSPGEHRAARWIADALAEQGVDAEVELESVHGTYWWPLGLCAAAGLAAVGAGRRGHRLLGAALGVAGGATVVDELSAGRRWLRRVLPRKRTANVVGRGGDPDGDRTLLLVAHHDAAHTSVFFDPRLSQLLGQPFRPDETGDQPVPFPPMTPIASAPVVAGLAALLRSRRLGLAAATVCAGIIGSFVEMAHRRTVPGANDNGSGVAVLLGLAAALRERPVRGLRVLLVSTGAEESLMEGMRAFVARHRSELDPDRTMVLCVDTVGSPYLVLPKAEGMLQVHGYDPELSDLVASCAADAGVHLTRGMTVRLGTDALVTVRAGIPSAMVMSVGDHGVSTNYHWPTDIPDHVDLDRVADVVSLCDVLTRRLAA